MRILTLDGGGIHAIHTAVVLKRLETACPGFLSKVDLFAGTSAGGMISLFLAAGNQVSDIIGILANADAFFTRSLGRRVQSELGLCAKYDSTGRLNILTQYLGTQKLADFSKFVVIQSFQLGTNPTWRDKVFHNIKSTSTCLRQDSLNMLAVDAGMATSAAPYYFPSYQGFIDGGVASNDPTMTALAMTQDSECLWPWRNTPLAGIKIFSIGRNYGGDRIDTSNGQFDSGWTQWLPKIGDLLLTSNQSVVRYQTERFLGNNYFRHNGDVPIGLDCAIDDTSGIPALQAWAEGIPLTKEIAWLETNWS